MIKKMDLAQVFTMRCVTLLKRKYAAIMTSMAKKPVLMACNV
jgi:hypothetical protein